MLGAAKRNKLAAQEVVLDPPVTSREPQASRPDPPVESQAFSARFAGSEPREGVRAPSHSRRREVETKVARGGNEKMQMASAQQAACSEPHLHSKTGIAKSPRAFARLAWSGFPDARSRPLAAFGTAPSATAHSDVTPFNACTLVGNSTGRMPFFSRASLEVEKTGTSSTERMSKVGH